MSVSSIELLHDERWYCERWVEVSKCLDLITETLIRPFLSASVDPGKGGWKEQSKKIVLDIKEDQDPGWFIVIFSSYWMGSWAVFWWVLIACTRTKEQQQLKLLLLVQNKLTRCKLPWICRETLCVYHPCFLYCHMLHCKATGSLLSVEDIGTCQWSAPGENGLLYLSFLFSHGRNLCCITTSCVL